MIALDVMGGDHAPQAILLGALSAAKSDIPVKLFGPEVIIVAELNAFDSSWRQYPLTIADAPSQIEMDEEPVAAVRKKRDSSLVKAVESVRDGQCSSVISAGNSGALMVAATLVLGRLPGVERPAIAGFLPAVHGPVVALDLGANTECRAHHLVQFAQLGADYAAKTLHINNPRIGLLSNGQEDGKGSTLTKETFALLKQTNLNFVGNVEPYDVFMNKADVVVCDGFTGNILLKTMESVFELFVRAFREELSISSKAQASGDEGRVEWATQFIQKIAKNSHKEAQGGALLLGVQGCALVCHGNSDAAAIDQTIRFAYAQHNAIQSIKTSIIHQSISHQAQV